MKGDTASDALEFDELDERAKRIAATLKRAGASGQRALLLHPHGLDYIAAFFGCLYAGVVATPLPPIRRGAGPSARLQAVAADCAARFALSSEAALDDAMRALSGPGVTPPVVIATDAPGEDMVADGGEIDGASVAFLQYTSGSTGEPKGVMVTHGSLAATLEDLDRGFRHRADSVIVSWLPLFHDLGLIYGALQPVFSGCSGVLIPPASFLQRPLRWLKAISDHRGTHSAAPNFAYDMCVQRVGAEEKARLDLSSWEVSLNAAEPVREHTIRRFVDCFASCGLRPNVVSGGYGLAEATLKVTSADNGAHRRVLRVDPQALSENRVVEAPADQPGQEICGCGRTHNGSRIVIVEPVACRRCAAGEIGEIWVQGPSVAAGYFRRPAESAATFAAHLADTGEGPFLRTGDLGFLAGDELYVTGRLSDMIIVRGQNHYPQDIEATIQRCHPALAAHGAGAFDVEVDGEQRLVVVSEVSRQALRSLDAQAAFAAMRRAVAEEHELRLDAIALLHPLRLPKTSSGKVMRRACRAAFLAGTLDPVAAWRREADESARDETPDGAGPTPDNVRLWLRRRVAAFAGLPERAIDCGEPFTSFGMDSAALVRLSAELSDRIGRTLPPTIFYDLPSIDATARHFADPRASSSQGRAPVDGPIAVVGLACRFPGGENAQAFWNLLSEGRDVVAQAPPLRDRDSGRAGAPLHGCFLPRVDLFDAEFFGVSRHEAERMDPQQRLLLEVAWEALEAAAIAPSSLAGSRTGVFVGVSTADYLRLQTGAFDGYAATGNAFSIAANRISYRFDLRGPSVALDTACSSSLVAVHQASESLRRGECDLALVGGVNLILAPDLSDALAKAGMLAPDGRCKVFDARADGYGRGEGCGVVVLKRLADAIAAKDEVLATLCGSAINQGGRSNGLTAPNGLAQQSVIRAALERAGVAPKDVEWVECHGTGTPLGDPIEVGALAATLLDGRDPGRPLRLTSVKANIGHLEAAAGIAGLIKVVLALRAGATPAQAGLGQLNPSLAIDDVAIRIPRDREPWLGDDRVAGVSSFGFGGANAHVVLRPAPAFADAQPAIEGPYALCLSARDFPALVELARRYASFLEETELPLADICRTALVGRSHFACRLAAVSNDAQTLRAMLRAFAAGEEAQGLLVGAAVADPASAACESGTRPGGREAAVAAAARAYVAGDAHEAAALHGAGRRRAFAPTYPFQRQRYWFDGSRDAVAERRGPRATEAARLFHRLEWRDAPAVERPLPESVTDVLILGDEGGVGAALGDLLRARSRRCHLFENGDSFARLSPGRWRLDFARLEHLARAATEAAAGGPGLSDVVFFATSDDPALANDNFSPSALEAVQARGAFALIGALQALLSLAGAQPPRLRIVTRGAISAGLEPDAASLPHAGVWGILRTLLLEQPGLDAVGLDLEREAGSVEEEAAALLAELAAPPGEDHIAWRGGRRFVGRMRRGAPPARGTLEIARNRCHLVTGGLGELGLQVARWLIERGARDVVLAARRRPDAAAAGALDALRRAGARVEAVSVDVADAAEMASLFDRLDRAGRPLGGVMHLAGVRDDMLLTQITRERFQAALRPKVLGGWILNQMTRERDLDYFVLFSSIASGFGAPGQTCYAVANAFLDALAHWRRAHGLPALSINWGPWSGGGMAEGLSPVYLRRMGVSFIAPTIGLEALELAMRGDDPQVMVCPFDWPAIKRNHPWVRRRRLLEEVESATQQPAAVAAGAGLCGAADSEAILAEIRSLTPDAMVALIDGAVGRALA